MCVCLALELLDLYLSLSDFLGVSKLCLCYTEVSLLSALPSKQTSSYQWSLNTCLKYQIQRWTRLASSAGNLRPRDSQRKSRWRKRLLWKRRDNTRSCSMESRRRSSSCQRKARGFTLTFIPKREKRGARRNLHLNQCFYQQKVSKRLQRSRRTLIRFDNCLNM